MSKYQFAIYEVYSISADTEVSELVAIDTYEAENIGEAYAQAAEKHGGIDRYIELKKDVRKDDKNEH